MMMMIYFWKFIQSKIYLTLNTAVRHHWDGTSAKQQGYYPHPVDSKES